MFSPDYKVGEVGSPTYMSGWPAPDPNDGGSGSADELDDGEIQSEADFTGQYFQSPSIEYDLLDEDDRKPGMPRLNKSKAQLLREQFQMRAAQISV